MSAVLLLLCRTACNFLQNGDANFSIFACNFWEFALAKNILERSRSHSSEPVEVLRLCDFVLTAEFLYSLAAFVVGMYYSGPFSQSDLLCC